MHLLSQLSSVLSSPHPSSFQRGGELTHDSSVLSIRLHPTLLQVRTTGTEVRMARLRCRAWQSAKSSFPRSESYEVFLTGARGISYAGSSSPHEPHHRAPGLLASLQDGTDWTRHYFWFLLHHLYSPPLVINFWPPFCRSPPIAARHAPIPRQRWHATSMRCPHAHRRSARTFTYPPGTRTSASARSLHCSSPGARLAPSARSECGTRGLSPG